MKKIGLIFLCSTFTCYLKYAYGQTGYEDQIIRKNLKRFYVEHNKAWSSKLPYQTLIKKLDSLQMIYCSAAYRVQLKKELRLGGLDHDLITRDLGTDLSHLKTIEVKKDSSKPLAYIVSFISPMTTAANKAVEQKVVLHIYMKRENDR